MKKCQAITVCACRESGCRGWGDLLCFLIWGCMSGKKKRREVVGAAFVGVHETGMPCVASVPGEEVAGRAGFLPNAQGALEMGSFTECQATDTEFHEEIFKMF